VEEKISKLSKKKTVELKYLMKETREKLVKTITNSSSNRIDKIKAELILQHKKELLLALKEVNSKRTILMKSRINKYSNAKLGHSQHMKGLLPKGKLQKMKSLQSTLRLILKPHLTNKATSTKGQIRATKVKPPNSLRSHLEINNRMKESTVIRMKETLIAETSKIPDMNMIAGTK
jgi:hypothetical protein